MLQKKHVCMYACMHTYITLHYITLNYITLHYIHTYIYTYIIICIYVYANTHIIEMQFWGMVPFKLTIFCVLGR